MADDAARARKLAEALDRFSGMNPSGAHRIVDELREAAALLRRCADAASAIICGSGQRVGASIHPDTFQGCHEYLSLAAAYRCADCGLWMHRPCLAKHFHATMRHDVIIYPEPRSTACARPSWRVKLPRPSWLLHALGFCLLRLLRQITGGRPMECVGYTLWDVVAHRPVYYWPDHLGRRWMAFSRWSVFRSPARRTVR